MPSVTIPYKPRNWAKPFHVYLGRWIALVLHRRAGKTTAVLNHHQRYAMDNAREEKRLRSLAPHFTDAQIKDLVSPPGGRHYGHVMPFRTQAKLAAWDKLKFYAQDIPGVKINESELLVRYPTGHKLQLFGADDPDSFRSFGGSGLSFDEYSQMPGSIFSEVLSKALADHLGYAIFCGTIKGMDQLYRTYMAAKDDPAWFALWQDIDRSLETEDGSTIQVLAQAMNDERDLVRKGLMTQAEFDQEWYLSPEAAIKGAIYGKELAQARKDGRIGKIPFDPALPVDTDWDIGSLNTAVWFSQSLRTGEVRLIDYLEDSEVGIPHYAAALKEKAAKRGFVYGQHWGPHDIVVRSFSTGKTRVETAREFGIDFKPGPRMAQGSGREVEEGINAAKLLFGRCWFDSEHCSAGIEALTHYRRDFNKRLDEFKPDPLHDWSSHGADAFRGLAVRYRIPELEIQRRKLPMPQKWAFA